MRSEVTTGSFSNELGIAMNVKSVEIQAPRRPSCLANARIELEDADGLVITIDDFRILRNKQGQVWVSTPCYSVPEGRNGYKYEPTIIFPRELKRTVEDAVLAEYERWEATQQ